MAAQLRSLLEPEFDVVATVADGWALLTAADAFVPDVVVTDIGMPRLDGIAATAALRDRHPGIRIVLVTIHTDAEVVRRGLAAGALGYVLKVTAMDDLVPAVRAALRDEQYVSPSIGECPA